MKTIPEMPDIQPFHAMTIGAEAFRLQEAGRSIIHMEYGQPSAQPPTVVIQAAQKMLIDGVKGYWESDELKSSIAHSYSSLYGIDISPRQIILTCGASPALALALMTSFAPGARIAMARPGYVAHRNVVAGLHMRPVELACGIETRFQLNAAMLDAVDPIPDGVIISSPANPTGSIIPNAELEKIVAVCDRKNIRIISDEIYNLISYGDPVACVAQFTDNAYILNGFSKYYAMPGWRLGWLLAPEPDASRAHAYMSNFFLTPPSLSAQAGIAALACSAELETHIETYRSNRAMMLEALPRFGLDEVAPPDGAFYIYAKVDQFTDDSLELCLNLLKDTGVATASGIDFDPIDGHRYMRFSFAVTENEVRDALNRIEPWFEARRSFHD